MELKRRIPEANIQSEILLIVPYGIETPEQNYSPHPDNTFNRTLWN